MKTLILLPLLLSLIFTSFDAQAAKSCERPLDGRDPNEWVHMGNGDIAVALYMCDSCQGWRRPTPEGKENKRSCEGCGNPFGSTDKMMEPNFQNRGGQTWVQAKFLPLSEAEADVFRKGGEDWACGSCSAHVRNWAKDTTCVGCGAPKSGALKNFDPHAAVPYRDTNAPKVATNESPQSVTAAPAKITPEEAAVTSPRVKGRTFPSSRTNKIVLSSALAAFLAIGGAARGFYNYIHPGDLMGTVQSVTKEVVIFKDEATYKRYKNVTLDLQHPPQDVRVVAEKDVTVEKVENPTETAEGYIVRMIYANIEVNGRIIHLALPVDQEHDWSEGDKVQVAFLGPQDFDVKSVK